MKLEKAIEELSDLHKVGLNRLTPDEKDAIKLGIEALKHTLFLRKNPKASTRIPLPSETKE